MIEFNCINCQKKFESEEQLYPHYLFTHGIYKQTCSTDVALRQFEKQQELSSRYELLRSELVKVVGFIKRGRQTWFNGQVTQTYDDTKPNHCQKCLRGVHEFRKDLTLRSCKKEVHITYGGKGYRFPCACDCNTSIQKSKKCPFCDLVTLQGPLTNHIYHSFKKNLKWN